LRPERAARFQAPSQDEAVEAAADQWDRQYGEDSRRDAAILKVHQI